MAKEGRFPQEGKIDIITGEKVTRLVKEIKPETAITQLQGRVACKGEAKGKVRLIITRDDLTKLQEGDILVAHETTPELLPGMKKAAGIITARGGITSHAAIVSQEMGKPCIVGVKGIIEAVSDGTEVQLDTQTGNIILL